MSKAIWTTEKGKKILVSKMDDRHLVNALRKIGSEDYPWEEYRHLYDALLEEALERDLDYEADVIEPPDFNIILP